MRRNDITDYRCPQCGVALALTDQQRYRLRRGVVVYCGRACYAKAQMKRTERACRRCGAMFVPKVARAGLPGLYCSIACHNAAQAERADATRAERFWSKVDRSGECWLWTGSSRGSNNYGQFAVTPKRSVAAHRFAYELTHGPIPDGMLVCHTCDTPRCVRPEHLWLGTPLDNHDDMKAKGRSPRGEANGARKHPERMAHGERNGRHTKPESTVRGARHYLHQRPELAQGERNGHAKLTWEAVADIRSRYAAGGITQQRLADEYGVQQATISQIILGKKWVHSSSPGE